MLNNRHWPRSKNSLSLKLTKSGNYRDFFCINMISRVVTTYYHHNSHRDQEKPVSTVRPIYEMDRRLNHTPDPPLPPCRMIKTGPNDASGVVWATGMYFLFYNRVLLILTNFFTLSRLYLPHNNTGKVGLCYDDQNGHKRCIWRCLDR